MPLRPAPSRTHGAWPLPSPPSSRCGRTGTTGFTPIGWSSTPPAAAGTTTARRRCCAVSARWRSTAATTTRRWSTTSRPHDAITHYRTALAMSRAIGDSPVELQCLNGLGMTYRQLGRLDQAAACLEQVLAMTRGADEHRWLAPYALATLGNVQLDRGALDEAKVCFHDAVRLARRFGDPRAEAYAMRGQADALRRAGDLHQSEARLREVLALVRRLGEDVGEALTLRRLGDVLGELGRCGEAAACLDKALAVATAVGHRSLEAETLYRRGVLYRRQGKLTDAAAALERSLALFRQQHRCLPHAEAAHQLSQVLEQLGERARDLRAEALRVAPCQRSASELPADRAHDVAARNHR